MGVSTGVDSADSKLLGLLQVEFPLMGKPYAELGRRLGIDEEKILERVQSLKAKGVVRQIGPVMDARKLGYRSTLVAMKVPGERLAVAEEIIIAHPGVSHGYERDNDFNIWITVSVPNKVDIKSELEKLASDTGAGSMLDLPAVKVFKLRAYFGVDEDEVSGEQRTEITFPLKAAELSGIDRVIINGLPPDLPLVSEPFNMLAASLGLSADDFLTGCQSLLQRGIIRRFGASINHRKAGYQANAMTCWSIPRDAVDDFGKKLSSLRGISHCYERRISDGWLYNLFAMIHGRARPDCQNIVDRVCNETGLTDYVMLFSTREFKKTRIKYLV